MFGACCCANGGEDNVLDDSRIIQEIPSKEHVEMPEMPKAAKEERIAPRVQQPTQPIIAKKVMGVPPPAGVTFVVSIHRSPSEPIGLDIDLIDGVSAVVVDIKEGAVKQWNDMNPEKALKVHDRIVEVNGSRGDSNSLVTRLKSDTVWMLQVQRPAEFAISINRSDAPSLGMDLRYAPNGTTLMITQVGEGPMQEWNTHNPHRVVHRHDRIIELNGVRGTPPQLLAASEDAETLDLVIIHFPPM
mmetsp:Transcript_8895/g.31583  ORF Transcript_8895/g.31583 Transcript_8895/m.31583 type:complete len:244 (-) Transcript_8895:44-775(-)